MNTTEAAQLLAVIQTYDQRTVGETDVIAWQKALEDLPFSDCRDAVVGHYQAETDRIMPANVRVRAVLAQRQAAGEERQHELEALRGRGSQELVPMPDWFRSTVEEHRRRARAARGPDWKPGDPTSFGEAILTTLDRMPKNPGGGEGW
jgi:hypothetical protein